MTKGKCTCTLKHSNTWSKTTTFLATWNSWLKARRSRKCKFKTLLRTIKRNLRMMSSWFLIPEWFLISSLYHNWLRGLSYVEVEVTGPNRDLHSGLYGGAVANPINILAKMIALFMTRTTTLPSLVLRQCRRIILKSKWPKLLQPWSYKNALKLNDVYGEKGYVTNERNSIRPTLDVNGIWGLYWWRCKTVIASQAFAKISMRLVPNQDWEQITELFTKHLWALLLWCYWKNAQRHRTTFLSR
jgi:hypothetical protein